MKVPPHTVGSYKDSSATVHAMDRMSRGLRGDQSLDVRLATEDAVRWVTPRDALSELAAIRNWVARRWAFLRDPLRAELVRDPQAMIEELREHGRARGDCDDVSLLIGTMPRTIGRRTCYVRMKWRRGGDHTHISAAGIDQHGRTVVLDPVAGEQTPKALGTVSAISIDALGEVGDMPGPAAVGEFSPILDQTIRTLRARAYAVRSAATPQARATAATGLGQAIETGRRINTEGNSRHGGTWQQWLQLGDALMYAQATKDQAGQMRYRDQQGPLTATPIAVPQVAPRELAPDVPTAAPPAAEPPAAAPPAAEPTPRHRRREPDPAPLPEPPPPQTTTEQSIMERAMEFLSSPLGIVASVGTLYLATRKKGT